MANKLQPLNAPPRATRSTASAIQAYELTETDSSDTKGDGGDIPSELPNSLKRKAEPATSTRTNRPYDPYNDPNLYGNHGSASKRLRTAPDSVPNGMTPTSNGQNVPLHPAVIISAETEAQPGRKDIRVRRSTEKAIYNGIEDQHTNEPTYSGHEQVIQAAEESLFVEQDQEDNDDQRSEPNGADEASGRDAEDNDNVEEDDEGDEQSKDQDGSKLVTSEDDSSRAHVLRDPDQQSAPPSDQNWETDREDALFPDPIDHIRQDASLFSPPASASQVPVQRLTSDSLRVAMTDAGYAGWTGMSHSWQEHLLAKRRMTKKEEKEANKGKLIDRDLDAQRWLDEQAEGIPTGLVIIRRMLSCSYELYHILHEAPTRYILKKQGEYFQREDVVSGLKESIYKLASRVEVVKTDMPAFHALRDGETIAAEREEARITVEYLQTKVIPFLCLLAKETFIVAGSKSRADLEDPPDLPKEGYFSEPLLRVLLRISTWILDLHKVMVAEMQRRPPKERDFPKRMGHREFLGKHIKGLKVSVLQALEQMVGSEPEDLVRQQLAAERDESIRQAREAEERLKQERLDLRIQWHQASVQRFMPTLSSQRESSQYQPASSAPVPRASMTPRMTPKEEYAARNHGWDWDQDNKVLAAIRRVANPDLEEMARIVPPWSVDAVEQRIRELKAISYKWYESRGKEPPDWCY